MSSAPLPRLNKATLVRHLGEFHGLVRNGLEPHELKKWTHAELLKEHERLVKFGACEYV